MKLGMYTIEMKRPTTGELFAAIKNAGFSEVQFDFSSVCDEQLPFSFAPGLLEEIQRQAVQNKIEIVAVNGTFNMIHPSKTVREDGYKRFASIAEASRELNCNFITLCTGSRNTKSMWVWHEDNQEPEAWEDLLVSTDKVLEQAERYDLILGIECEPNNCINTPDLARKLLDTFKSPRLKIIMDIANLFQKGQARKENVRPIMDHAFELIGQDIYLAHGKDIKDGDDLNPTYAGNGIVDFEYFLEKLDQVGYTGGMLLHGIHDERYFADSVAYINDVISKHKTKIKKAP
ncbi:sugar phosphate isomerase/epimerase family protein [Lederbergia panacisoli]|uniref:sugar phosphate isomerase/epimerase family protein n=1 Tax=Lederbergia panacisoli TaxID=1255251 RepID=UPI00214BA5C3|nr:sugar phosphate isomerase/epimerase [Lederbergia panacisoli]MCR2821317.1 sugar phosphate isomerase/epimerase [Lederbergia panacisoli]